MLARRIIPVILSKNGLLVKGTQFSADRVVGNALQAARIHAMRGVDELMILDVSATKDNREPNYRMIEQLTQTTRIPVTVGGGIRHLSHVQGLFNAGADKVCIGTRKSLIRDISASYGCQAVVASVDAVTHVKAMAEMVECIELGAGEILLQDVRREGTMEGFDLDLVSYSDRIDVPLIISGGCKDYEDMKRAFDAGASGVAVGALFQFTDATPRKAAQYLDALGVEVRL
jgi:cyclase